jgi:hypothetical protein
METKILQVKSQNQKNVILKILEDDNSTTYHTFEDYDNENILVDGLISFEAMAKIVDYLRCNIKKGVWYKCIKDVFDNENKLRLFTKGEYYLCSKDNTLLANNDKVIYCNNLNNLSECFVEDYCVDK